MKMQIKDFAAFTGVSVRTLHYYHEIGLLPPACVDRSTGYRYYDEASLLRMQEILFYRELDFSLKSIEEILTSPNYDKQQALQEQQSREAWQSKHSPSTVQYVDVQTGAGAFSNANAAAAALAYQNQNFGLNSAIGGCNFLRVARYSAPQPCGCDAE